METVGTHHNESRAKAFEFLGGGSLAESVAGAGAMILAIVALSGVEVMYLAAIATIAMGAALLFEGAAIAAEYSRLISSSGDTMSTLELGGGVTAESLGGIAGVVLGVLALLHVAPLTLMAIAVIVFGGTLIVATAANLRLKDLRLDGRRLDPRAHRTARAFVAATAGTQVLVGIGALVLGIIALQGIAPLTLAAIALLGLGAAVLLSGSALGAEMLEEAAEE
jgi:hypothetical protein